jgi:hypothetical protein
MTKAQPMGIHASIPWLINFLTSRYAQIAEIIGMAKMTKNITNIPMIKKAGDLTDKSGKIHTNEKAKITINATMAICNISNPTKNKAFFIILGKVLFL